MHKLIKNSSIFFRLILALRQINKFNSVRSSYHKQAKKIIRNQIITHYPDLPNQLSLKMQWYMAECLFTCEAYHQLLGHRSTMAQRKLYLQSGALITLCDYVVDELKMDVGQIKQLNTHPEKTKSPITSLYLYCNQLVMKQLKNDQFIKADHYFNQFFDAQLQSAQQHNPSLTKDAVDQICKAKCGYMMLFLRSLIGADHNCPLKTS